MAPRKEKAEKVSADEAAASILNYLRKLRHPLQATDISANLHNKVTKAAAAKILKDLHERNEIEGRAAGKQIVYHALQNADDAIAPEALAALDTQIVHLRTNTTTLLSAAKTLRSTLSSLNSSLTTSDLISSVLALQTEKAEILVRLENLRAGKAKKVTKKEREQIEGEWKKWSSMSKRREKISCEMWKLVEDCLPEGGDKGEARESLGLDD
ncbi:Tat binding protein 1-interacting [Lindgomyces ingoldianus]|uniref:Tat binding protein 1-interacting n=1 Tax=Lindgomyces ingoldianus TaxID=673940 RepID=A0ACB6QII5_9PLEO|nr:Tat binding protein 1-interacting [Lindgomyces ingoldianus]KAF2466813.1 Tat binding protein 1-interacting [Lindgomyces ingoldianus]